MGTITVALLILFEEWGWGPLARWMSLLARLPLVRRLERFLIELRPAGALLAFCVPALLLLPVKIGALWLIGQGRRVAGVTVLVLAKIVGTAVVARIFLLTRPQLMRLPWFARGYARWLRWKATVMARMRVSPPWALARTTGQRLRAWWRAG